MAEDEILERHAVRDALLRARPGEILVLEAANGLEAVEIAKARALDAAFLDIRMPGLDGMDAALELRRLKPGLPLVFLTACDSFEYARRAVRLGVDEYILKPAADEEILGALELMLESRRDSLQGQKIRSAAAYLEEEIARDLGQGRADPRRVAEYARINDFRAEPPLAAAFLISLGRSAQASPGFKRAILNRVLVYARSCLGAAGYSAMCGAGPDHALVLGFRNSPGSGEARAAAGTPEASESPAKGMAADIRRRVMGDFGIALRAGVYEAPAEAAGGLGVDPAALALGAARLATLAIPIVVSRRTWPEEPAASERGEAPAANPLAKAALASMRGRLGQEISLESVAAELRVSPSHLSRVLVQATDRGFSDNLAEMRIQAACALLRAGASVKEASNLVGIRDSAYFSKVFRRVMGASPTEYAERRRSGPDSVQEERGIWRD